jgi:peroxiredoxin
LHDAKLIDPHGAMTTLYEALGDQVAVLVFYRGAWCPYCNIALNTYQAELIPELGRRGVKLFAVSPQAPDGSLSTQEKNGLTFAVLSDPGNQVAKALGILTAPSAEARAAQLELGLDLAAVNADGTTGLPMPTTVILDPELVVRWVDVHPDYTTRSEPAQILAALDAIAAR